MKKKIGLPNALIHYKFHVLWKTFFTELGTEVIISDETTKKIREIAISAAPDEDCYSTKLYFGHALVLKDKVDYLFIPRFGSNHPTNVGCPKFLGLADVLRSMFPDLPPLIMPYFSKAKGGHKTYHIFTKAFAIGWMFTKNPIRIIRAISRAIKAYQKYKDKLIISIEDLEKWERSKIYLNDPPILRDGEKPLKIALVGHSYVINDGYASLDIRKKLKEQGVDIITSEQMPRELIEKQMEKLDFNMYFDYEREILGTLMHFIESKTVDGIIHLMIFGCGPDSIAGEMAARFSKRDSEVQLLQLVLDDLTAEAGLNTRIEAFADMLKRRNLRSAVYLPPLRVSEIRV
ncbi:MAG TPA: acyl-CoA dehydratase activase-related protein [candidate division Zixibacteria bacterium]|nr:acyl-CoA dehydratase activase-related protein [candidate division Zixibacteria bacterium]